MARFNCQHCFERIELSEGFAKAKVRCPACGYYAEVPAEQRAAGMPPTQPERQRPGQAPPAPAKPKVRVRRAKDPRDHRPQFEADRPTGPPLLEGTHDPEDDRPYTVPGAGTTNCPHCRGELPFDAKLCVHCGRNLSTGERAGRSFQAHAAEWVEGWPPQRRLQLFAAAQVINALIALRILALGETIGFSELFWTTFSIGIHVALQAFIIGTFDTLALDRSEGGKTVLTRVRRIGFYPFPAQKLDWKSSHAVGVTAGLEVGCFTWGVCVYLIFLGVLPGVIFYWVVIRPDRYVVVLTDVYGSIEEVVLRSTDLEQATGAARQIAESTGLIFKRVF